MADEQPTLVNRVNPPLPERHRFNHLTDLDQPSVERKPLWHMIEADPSEAVRSSDILDIVPLFF